MDTIKKAIYIKGLLPRDIYLLLTHVLLRNRDYPNCITSDEQVSNVLSIMEHDVLFETVQEKIWNKVEEVVGEELLPTYSYARLYTNGNDLKKHIDRPACEVSLTVQLGRSHHYAWPIYLDGIRMDLAEGDGILYPGCIAEHWRNTCDGPDGYYSGQVFFHFVRKNGPYAHEAGDSTTRKPIQYIKNRTITMETK